MRQVAIDDVEAGARLAEPLYGAGGLVLLQEGCALTAAYLAELRARGLSSVFVQDDDFSDVRRPMPLRPETRAAAAASLQTSLGAVAGRVGRLRETHGPRPDAGSASFGRDVRRALGPAALAPVLGAAAGIVDDLAGAVGDEAVLSGLGGLRAHDSYTFDHSIDVTILGVLLARRAGWARRALGQFAVGLLLHDLGKIFIDPGVLNKPRRLDDAEFERMKAHPEVGHGMVRALLPDVGPLPRQVAHQHHERQDGTGYPRGLRGSNTLDGRQAGLIHPFGAVAAVADVYDALASDRPYRAGLPADQAVKLVADAAGRHLNAEAIELFRQVVAPYPTCGEVVLDGGPWAGHRAVVVGRGAECFGRPRVRLLSDAAGRRVRPAEIALADEPGVPFHGVTPRRAREFQAAA